MSAPRPGHDAPVVRYERHPATAVVPDGDGIYVASLVSSTVLRLDGAAQVVWDRLVRPSTVSGLAHELATMAWAPLAAEIERQLDDLMPVLVSAGILRKETTP